jgi:hypothetical protein
LDQAPGRRVFGIAAETKFGDIRLTFERLIKFSGFRRQSPYDEEVGDQSSLWCS